MTIASSCGWWSLLASSSVNVMAYSSVVLVLEDRLESWTFCTTFRYVFLDLENCPVKVTPMMTLISPNWGLDGSSNFAFNFSSKEISQLPLPDEIFYKLFQIKTLICIMSMVSMEAAILVPIALIGIFLHFFRPLQRKIILDLHKHLFKRHVQRRVLLTPC